MTRNIYVISSLITALWIQYILVVERELSAHLLSLQSLVGQGVEEHMWTVALGSKARLHASFTNWRIFSLLSNSFGDYEHLFSF
jgi:hypothetical protein